MKKRILILIMAVSLLFIPTSVYGEVLPMDPATTTSDDLPILQTIVGGSVRAAKSGSNLNYNGSFQFSNTTNKVKVTIQKLKYTNGAYAASGTAVVKSYSNRTTVTLSGSFDITSSATYKVKMTVSETKGSTTTTKTYYSLAV